MLLMYAGLAVAAELWVAYGPDEGTQIIARLLGVKFLLVTVAFASWKVAAYRLASVLGWRPLRWSPSWAVGGYFIPIGNLWIPFMIMREISDVSDPSAVEVEVWERDTRKVLLGVWWGLWVTALVLRQIYNLIPAPGGAVDSGGYDIVGLLGWAAGFFATIAAFLVVRRIDADQQALGARLLDARVGLEGSFPEVA